MRVKATESQIADGLNGGCIQCGKITEGGVEPDAREYECWNCGADAVYGLEELLVMNALDLI